MSNIEENKSTKFAVMSKTIKQFVGSSIDKLPNPMKNLTKND